MNEDEMGIWCREHWEEVLTSGADPELVCLIMLERLLHHPEFLADVPMPRDEAQLTMALTAITPVCCWLGEGVMAATLVDAWVRAAV